MGKKLTYDEVKYYIEVESDSGCKLISEEYTNSINNIDLKCACGNYFAVRFGVFKSRKKRFCNECGEKNRLKKRTYTLDEVKDYVNKESKCTLLSNEYIHNECDLEFKCHCGNIFNTTFNRFKNTTKKQCTKCGIKQRQIKRTISHDDFCKRISEEFNEELVPLEEYKAIRSEIKFKCLKCNKIFVKQPIHMLHSNVGCPTCSKLNQKKKLTLSHKDFVFRVKEIYGDEYLVTSIYKDMKTEIEVICKKHGSFITKPIYLIHHKSGCSSCTLKSKGEKTVSNVLTYKKIKYVPQKSLIKTNRKLKFDFALKRLLIEYDGGQHFKSIEFFGGIAALKSNIKRDKIKNQYCIDNNIPLLRIPYWEQSNIESILSTALMHFDIIPEDDSYDYTLIKEWLVDANWDHDAYIAKCPKNIKEAAKVLVEV